MHLWSAVGVLRDGWLVMVSTGMAGTTGVTEVSLHVFSPPETGQLGLVYVQFEEFQKQQNISLPLRMQNMS